MDEDRRERIVRAAEEAALFNAIKHGGEAQVGAIVGSLMGEYPEFRELGDDVPAVVAPVVDRVNDMEVPEQRDRLGDMAPDRLAALEAEPDTDRPLPELPNVEAVEEVRMRLAPNPNGPWHIGSARMPAVIGTYAERYDGWMLCRFDDTDPETKRPDLAAYDAIVEDIEYLGFEPDDVVRASDRLETYYEHARALIAADGAYTCSCEQDDFSGLKAEGTACDHRDKAAERTSQEFASMVDGDVDAGEMVLRVRTDMGHPNPALRDWVAFRVVDRPHPRPAASEYRCWPMLDFQSGIDDHLFEITHVIRGIDLQDSAKRQRFVYDYFDWEYPEVVHWGHVQVDEYDVDLSTSTIKEHIANGDLAGWDDPRAPTIASLRRRGIRGEAIVAAMVQLGTSSSHVDLAMSSVYAANRELVDDEADRAFLVRDGIERPIRDGPDTASPPVHPDHEERGERTIPVRNAVILEPADLPPAGEHVWLKGFGCVRHTGDALTFVDRDIQVVRDGDVDVVHWVPAEEAVAVSLRTPDETVTGAAEPGLRQYDPDTLLQFERVGFARLDEWVADGERAVFYFAHR